MSFSKVKQAILNVLPANMKSMISDLENKLEAGLIKISSIDMGSSTCASNPQILSAIDAFMKNSSMKYYWIIVTMNNSAASVIVDKDKQHIFYCANSQVSTCASISDILARFPGWTLVQLDIENPLSLMCDITNKIPTENIMTLARGAATKIEGAASNVLGRAKGAFGSIKTMF